MAPGIINQINNLEEGRIMIADLLATKLYWGLVVGAYIFVKVFLIKSVAGLSSKLPEFYSWSEKKTILKRSFQTATLAFLAVVVIAFVVVPGGKTLVKNMGNDVWEDDSGNLVVATPPTTNPDYTFRRDKTEGWYRSWLGNWRYSISNPYDERVSEKIAVISNNGKQAVLKDNSVVDISQTRQENINIQFPSSRFAGNESKNAESSFQFCVIPAEKHYDPVLLTTITLNEK